MKILGCLIAVGLVSGFNIDSYEEEQVNLNGQLAKAESRPQWLTQTDSEGQRWLVARNTVCNPRVKVCE